MAETTQPAADLSSAPKQICEKCRNEFTLDQFEHGIQDQSCVCRRCLRVMGYKVK